MSDDTTDFFREREKLAWHDYIVDQSVEKLLAWRRALQNLNDEVNARVEALLERHLAARRSSVQTSGKEPSNVE